ncbi:MtrB/PioB family decaheme-associated outer membrane protein [Ferrimonas lipolytica]|uniref:MtrB/PioB family decaheme-associated outer membrane protein n=1 Tax=Ferrimonas lipolytica TaxID=2724191 RepID=A0A6H1UBT4_9GAMM|nr:MtrB/PioB family decaheme-associated outer membrane protein [Ferrimonas lipolytica]QIZ76298.1 MtrB/PioB family decaheme-associated outer membrane protein [Ferrimonas lipolytica]
MNAKLSLVALAIMSAGTAHASGFDLNDANLESINKNKWSCKRCVIEQHDGYIGISALYVDADDARAATRFGDEDGFTGALQADIDATNDGARVQLQADDFGLETGRIEGQYRNDILRLHGGYQSILHVNADDAMTDYAVGNDVITDTGSAHNTTLELKRENWFTGIALNGESSDIGWNTFIDYRYTDKTGQQVKSSQFIDLPDANDSTTPANYVAPVDNQTQIITAGGQLSGQHWLAGLNYHGSLFDNKLSGINNSIGGNVQAYAPDNEAHRVSADGLYRFDNNSLSGRVVRGWLYQDDDFVTIDGAIPGITSTDAEVETWDINLRWNFRASSALRIKAKVDYRERDNKTPIRAFESIDFDPSNGRAVENVALDSERTAYQLQANYRMMTGAKLIAGYQYIDKELTDTVTEDTSEDRLFASLRYTRLANWDFNLDAEFGSRDGSGYQADAATSDEDNALLRKYHIADRDRTQVELAIRHTPLADLSIDTKLRYAIDDYSDTQIGLTESTDTGYDVSINYQPMTKLDLYLFASQQWIDSEQTDLSLASRYNTDLSDQFGFVGLGASYAGLMQDKLTLGIDYGYAESESETELSTGSAYGDYTAWSHNVDLYAEYQLSQQTKVKANYGYERYYDSNFGSVNSSSYTTLGNLNSNYVAHSVMLTFSYDL